MSVTIRCLMCNRPCFGPEYMKLRKTTNKKHYKFANCKPTQNNFYRINIPHRWFLRYKIKIYRYYSHTNYIPIYYISVQQSASLPQTIHLFATATIFAGISSRSRHTKLSVCSTGRLKAGCRSIRLPRSGISITARQTNGSCCS